MQPVELRASGLAINTTELDTSLSETVTVFIKVEHSAQRTFHLKAYLENEEVGFLSLCIEKDAIHIIIINNYTSDNQSKPKQKHGVIRGLGTAMMRCGFALNMAFGTRDMILQTRPKVVPFYEKMGFSIKDEQKSLVQRGTYLHEPRYVVESYRMTITARSVEKLRKELQEQIKSCAGLVEKFPVITEKGFTLKIPAWQLYNMRRAYLKDQMAAEPLKYLSAVCFLRD